MKQLTEDDIERMSEAELDAYTAESEREWKERIAAAEARGWKKERCAVCRGSGYVCVYSANDFEGADDCPTCKADGYVWRSPKGKYARWPGGPFCG